MAQYKSASRKPLLQRLLPLILFLMMWGTIVLVAAVLPLYYLQFSDALLLQLGKWTELPVHLLFPGFTVLQVNPRPHVPSALALDRAWKQDALLFASFVTVCLSYVLALRFLPRIVSRRYILITTALLGLVFVLFVTVMTSADVFSYIAYARMVVQYHLNPLTQSPLAMPPDPVFPYIYWTDQPSIYGPVWIGIASALQWISRLFEPGGLKNVALMVVILRLWELGMHLGSTALVWSIGGYLQRFSGGFFSENRQRRVLVTLAFAWNPLLLFEACVNAHVDTTMLFFVLFALWLFMRGRERGSTSSYILVAAVFALACCIKINVALLFPGLLLFLWWQKPRRVAPLVSVISTFLVVIVLVYAPFWQHGAVLNVLNDSPAGIRSINSLPDFLATLIGVLRHGPSIITGYSRNLPLYHTTLYHAFHTGALALFLLLYALHCWRAFRRPATISTSWAMIRWMAVAWMLYCAVGSPWFWPWYIVTFFGLFALALLVQSDNEPRLASVGRWRLYFKQPLAVYLLTLSMLCINCFDAWIMFRSAVPHLPGYDWANLRGLVWLLPLLALRLRSRTVASPARQNSAQLPLPGEHMGGQPAIPVSRMVKQ